MKNILLIFLLVGLLSACIPNKEVINHSFLYKGEGKEWKAELEYEAKEVWEKDKEGVNIYSGKVNYIFTLTYKGEVKELASLNKLSYTFKRGTTGEGSSTQNFDEPVTQKIFTSKGGGTGAIMREDESVHVEVEWDGKKEAFELAEKDLKTNHSKVGTDK
ncbi:hypothetical protein GLV94_08160 [Virgibacillus halodenitrificans]|uniref:hypothetical protein n=1 Tax=Virgibacillus halodenitrificans TaxID=1482 RepID=UPI0013716393|nr:hypothetical protein [Virgibacillus halodenitrificans]MYL45618.1 hypothetical protein [Virgibacillus halodenitrificans]